MRQPKRVEIPEDRRLSVEEYEKLTKHAKNSASYSCGMSLKSEREVRDKLMLKGYVEDDVIVTTEYSENTANIIDEVIEYLEGVHLLNEDRLAEKIIETLLDKGKGYREIQRKMFEKKIDKDIAEHHLEALDEDSGEAIAEALDSAVEAIQRKGNYRNEDDPIKRRQKLYRLLISRGFNVGEVKAKVDEIEEDEEYEF